jgi:hypothetical protein
MTEAIRLPAITVLLFIGSLIAAARTPAQAGPDQSPSAPPASIHPDGESRAVSRHLEQARLLAAEAVKQSNLRRFEDAKLSLERAWKALRPLQHGDRAEAPETKQAARDLLETWRSIYASCETFLSGAIGDQEVPLDDYAGPDREHLVKSVTQAWQRRWPGDQVLAVRFPETEWRRQVKETYDRSAQSWERTDHSVLGVQVIVRQTSKVATIHPVFVHHDNLHQGETVAVDARFIASSVREVLVSKLDLD